MTPGTAGLGPARDELLRLARGEHHDPHAILGAHPVGDGTVIRAFHPDATGVDLVAAQRRDAGDGAARRGPVGRDRRRASHRARSATGSASRSPTATPGSVTIRIRFGPTVGEIDLHLVARGHPRAPVRRARRSSAHARGHQRRQLRGLGAERAQRPDRRRLRPLGRPPPADAVDGRLGRVGALRAGHRRRRALQVRGARAATARCASRPIPSPSQCRSGPRPRRASGIRSDVPLDRCGLDGRSGRSRDPYRSPMSVYEVHLGSWMRNDDGSWLGYRQAAERARGALPRVRLHARRAAAGRRASVRRLVGLPGHRLLRAHRALRQPRRLRRHGRHAPQRRDRGDRGLGAGPLPERRLRAAQVRRHAALRARRSAARRAPGLGHPHLRLRPSRGAQLPRRQRALLVRPVSHRRAAGRCGGLDALPRLLAQGRRVDAEPVRRQREPRGHRLPARGERARLPSLTRAS